MRNLQVKICCISSIEEASLAIKAGASAIGLVGHMPSGPGVIDDELIREIAHSIPTEINSFLLTSETSALGIIAHHQKVNTTTIQIVDKIPFDQYDMIRQALPDVQLVQVIHVNDERSIQEAIEISEYVDMILLDSGNPDLKVKVLGGTGRTHNWDLSREIVKSVSIPVFLAGGLSSKNVAKAIEAVKPDGVDLCSGVRTYGKLDEAKLRDFFNAIFC